MTDANSRRAFLAATASLTASLVLPQAMERVLPPLAARAGRFGGPFCLFSKHLPDLGWADMGAEVKRAGFDGVDLTVRPRGHVLPERVREDLPVALRQIREHGLVVPMITTSLVSADHPTARPILATAGREQVAFFKPGYYRYAFVDVPAEIGAVARQVRALSALAAECGVQLGFHNHAGAMGAAIWDIEPVIGQLDARWVGYYFDPRHSVAEGGVAAWKVATHLVATRIKMVAVKDFYWEKRADGRWGPTDCPLGEGMVDWPSFCRILAGVRFQGPVSVHLEYDTGGKTVAARAEGTLSAARRDLDTFKRYLDEAYRS
jgi:sugar phosphate isomerase/epimerase